ncbi:MAG: hypothetical protein KGK04_01410 [Xanthomonadaceae bacterium]|nr:hypothetical protein [Xanthomonadaceae bacterium]
MRTSFLLLAAAALLGSTCAIADDSMSLNRFPHKVEPVLVRVDAHGRVTEASPAYALPAKMSRLLNANIREMISKPATDKHGRPISSEFIMNLALQAKPSGVGHYEAYFTYVSAKPVPPGSWYWVHIDGVRLALANQESLYIHRMRPALPVQPDFSGYRTTVTPPQQMPAMQSHPQHAR